MSNKPQVQDDVSLDEIQGDLFQVSDCHYADVENVVTETQSPEGALWQSSHFVCTKCKQECRIETNRRLVEALLELKQLKGDA